MQTGYSVRRRGIYYGEIEAEVQVHLVRAMLSMRPRGTLRGAKARDIGKESVGFIG